jgi:hypothetical protein
MGTPGKQPGPEGEHKPVHRLAQRSGSRVWQFSHSLLICWCIQRPMQQQM